MENDSSWWSFLGIVVTALGAVFIWFLNQLSKRKWEAHIRREKRYKRFLDSIDGFYENSQCSKSKNEFIRQLRLAWLYCPDSIIRQANQFLESVEKREKKSTHDEKETALANLVLEMRRDMVGKTDLNTTDFKIWTSLDG